MTEPDEDDINAFMERIREALVGEDPATVIMALAGQMGEWAINASRGDADVARAIVADAFEHVQDSIRRGAAALEQFRRQGLN